MNNNFDYDYIVIGSGFGGSVAALRLAEKGYSVLIIEKGKHFRAQDFPKSNWNIRKWLWIPLMRFYGFFKITIFRHVTILSGVGVGGGSLVYANTLPVPKKEFFEAESWSYLANWEEELQKFYSIALNMIKTESNPKLQIGDETLKNLATELHLGHEFEPTNVAVFFGEPDKTVPDPYYSGEGPERAGCNFCGGCMTGCRYNAKNTLDKNYLYFAQKNGAEIIAEKIVTDVEAMTNEAGGYKVFFKSSTKFFKKNGNYSCKGVVFSGGVLGTIPLLLKLKKKSLPRLSEMVGKNVRTNSESLIGITTFDKTIDFSKGIAIGSILHTDKFSHLEPVRYPAGSGFWRLLMSPMVQGSNFIIRIFRILEDIFKHPVKNVKAYFTDDWAKRTQILLYMRTLNSTLKFKRGLFRLKSAMDSGAAPTAFEPAAKTLADKYAAHVNAKPTVLLTETLMGIPTTAHILGGAVMGDSEKSGVIDKNNSVFGYENMYICDGSAISANPGVNPSLTILAISERAMSKIPNKSHSNEEVK